MATARTFLLRTILLVSLTLSATAFHLRPVTRSLSSVSAASRSASDGRSLLARKESVVLQAKDDGRDVVVATATKPQLDVDAVVKYTVSIATQMALFVGIFSSLDKFIAAGKRSVPFAFNFCFFYFWSLKSRIINPLSNKRPQRDASLEVDKDKDERKRPSVSSFLLSHFE